MFLHLSDELSVSDFYYEPIEGFLIVTVQVNLKQKLFNDLCMIEFHSFIKIRKSVVHHRARGPWLP